MKAPVTYIPNFIGENAATESFWKLWKELDWLSVAGPRIEYWTNDLGKPYTYGSGQGRRTYQSQPMHDTIIKIRDALGYHTPDCFEGCFLNGYRDRDDALGWHADDDPAINHRQGIAIVTLYAQPTDKLRKINFREVLDPGCAAVKPVFGPIEELELGHGSLAYMQPGMQDNWRHKIPKAGFECEKRISLTFRGLRP